MYAASSRNTISMPSKTMSTLCFGKMKGRNLWNAVNKQDPRCDPEEQRMVSCSTDSLNSEGDDKYEHNLALFHKHEVHIGSLIGEGSFCQVHDVRKVKLDSTLKVTNEEKYSRECVKLLSKKGNKNFKKLVIKEVNFKRLSEKSKDGDYIKMAVRDLAIEAKVLSRLHHVNIIDVLGSSFPPLLQDESGESASDSSTSFLLLERLPETLEDKIQRWRMSQEQATPNKTSQMMGEKIFIAYQIANALKYLHEQRIIFRDLKPRNIGLTKQGVVKLFDFGLCIELPSRNGSLKDKKERKGRLYNLSCAGTPRYMSPEMLLDQSYNEQTDVYSWAMVFHEMLTHERLYSNYTMTQLCVKVCVQKERPSLSSYKLPAKIESLLQRAWEHEITTRVTMKSVCKVLECILEESMSPHLS